VVVLTDLWTILQLKIKKYISRPAYHPITAHIFLYDHPEHRSTERHGDRNRKNSSGLLISQVSSHLDCRIGNIKFETTSRYISSCLRTSCCLSFFKLASCTCHFYIYVFFHEARSGKSKLLSLSAMSHLKIIQNRCGILRNPVNYLTIQETVLITTEKTEKMGRQKY
jgi:hypothetical protein